ncbi:MAG: hypothetical protein Q4D05_07935 [Acinetobacter sp.]|nr:hypothetical protein [Acinetobacter sp.]
MNNINQYIMVMSGGTEAPLIFGDLQYDARVQYLEKPLKPIYSKWQSLLRSVHLATRINKYIALPFRSVWDRSLSLSQIDFSAEKNYHIIFINTSIVKYHIGYLKSLKQKYNVHYYLYMVDSVHTEKGREVAAYLNDKTLFNTIYSFDQNDCQKYGFSYFVQPLSQIRIDAAQHKSDLYFLGRTKGRLPLLLALKEKVGNALNLNLKVLPENEDEKATLLKMNILSDYIPYQQNIQYVLATNVILELVQKNQSGNTLRYQEAIMYNKKLLTNNQNVVNMPFYNAQYIQVFDDVEHINVQWLSEKIAVDYGYNGEFSASRLIDDIEQRYTNNKGKIE